MSARLWGWLVDGLIWLASRKHAPRIDRATRTEATDQFNADAKARTDILRSLREKRTR